MVRFFLLAMLAGLVCVLPGCVTLADIVKGLEPIMDAGVQLAANSAGQMAQDAVKEQLGDQWSGGEITTAISGIILSAYGALKGATWLNNRNPSA